MNDPSFLWAEYCSVITRNFLGRNRLTRRVDSEQMTGVGMRSNELECANSIEDKMKL